WNKMGQNGVTQKELDEAKNYLISSYNLRFASIADIADILVYMQKDNLGLDFLKKRNEYVKAVRLEDVNRVSKKFFSEKNLIFVNIGNLGEN
ncbi:MAG: insulinase family protein, partial [Alphaproteobacteria bacterium]